VFSKHKVFEGPNLDFTFTEHPELGTCWLNNSLEAVRKSNALLVNREKTPRNTVLTIIAIVTSSTYYRTVSCVTTSTEQSHGRFTVPPQKGLA
jgi:hypothetical protein